MKALQELERIWKEIENTKQQIECEENLEVKAKLEEVYKEVVGLYNELYEEIFRLNEEEF